MPSYSPPQNCETHLAACVGAAANEIRQPLPQPQSTVPCLPCPATPLRLQFECCKPNFSGEAPWDPNRVTRSEVVSEKRSEGNSNCEREAAGWAHVVRGQQFA